MTLMSHLHKADGLGVPKERGADRVMSSILLSWAFKPARVMSSIFRVMSSILKGSRFCGVQTQNSLASITLGHSVRSKEATIFLLC